jgi:hypothetical protein
MTQSTPEQRAELRRLVDAQETNAHYRSDHPEHAAMVALLNAGPALLADAEALATIEPAHVARTFPLMTDDSRRIGYIKWSVAEEAYREYARQFGTSQSLERLAERGGFGLRELAMLLGKDGKRS